MKSYRLITLFASVLATVAIPSSLRAQASAAEGNDTPPSERQLELNNAEREALRKVYQDAVEEMHKLKDEMRTNRKKADDIHTYIRAMQWVVQVETKLRKFQPSDATKVAALTKRLDKIILDYASVGNIVFQCEILATQDKGIPFDNGINIVLMHTGETKETWRKLDDKQISLHDYLKALAKEAGLVVHIGEDVVSLRLPEDLALSEAAPSKPKVERICPELDFYEKTYGKEISGVDPKSEYSDPSEFYGEVAYALSLPEIFSEASDAKFGSPKKDGFGEWELDFVAPSADATKPGWKIVMACRTPKPVDKKKDAVRIVIKQKAHLDFKGNATFSERIQSVEQGRK
jgi:hypothetical protein